MILSFPFFHFAIIFSQRMTNKQRLFDGMFIISQQTGLLPGVTRCSNGFTVQKYLPINEFVLPRSLSLFIRIFFSSSLNVHRAAKTLINVVSSHLFSHGSNSASSEVKHVVLEQPRSCRWGKRRCVQSYQKTLIGTVQIMYGIVIGKVELRTFDGSRSFSVDSPSR